MSALHPPWEARRVGAAQRGAARCTSRARQHARAGCGVARSADSDHHHLATAAAPVQQHARGDPALAPRLRRPGGLPHADRRRRLRGECSRGAVGTVEERQDLGGGRRAVRAAQAARACGVRGRRAALRAGGADQPTSPSKADRAVRAHLTTSPHISRHLPTSPHISLCLPMSHYISSKAELVEQFEHRGFALGVRRAVLAARTEFVLVVQHDRPLRRHAPMAALIEAMDERAELTHVALPTGRTHPQTYEHFAVSKYALRLGEPRGARLERF